MKMIKKLKLTANEAGKRLDKYIVGEQPELSRSHIQKLIEEGNIKVGGKVVKPSYKTAIGDQIDITVPPETAGSLKAENIPLDIIYEDNDLILVNKPSGMTTHPAPATPNIPW